MSVGHGGGALQATYSGTDGRQHLDLHAENPQTSHPIVWDLASVDE